MPILSGIRHAWRAAPALMVACAFLAATAARAANADLLIGVGAGWLFFGRPRREHYL